VGSAHAAGTGLPGEVVQPDEGFSGLTVRLRIVGVVGDAVHGRLKRFLIPRLALPGVGVLHGLGQCQRGRARKHVVARRNAFIHARSHGPVASATP